MSDSYKWSAHRPKKAPRPTSAYEQQLREATSRGWQVVSEGPSGAQLRRPKQFRLITGVLLFLGVMAGLFLNVFFGAFLLLLGVLNHVFTKEETRFLHKPLD